MLSQNLFGAVARLLKDEWCTKIHNFIFLPMTALGDQTNWTLQLSFPINLQLLAQSPQNSTYQVHILPPFAQGRPCQNHYLIFWSLKAID